MIDKNKVIPTQITGEKSDYEYSIPAESPEEAAKIFRDAAARLLDVNEWNKLCGAGSATFRLANDRGKDLKEVLQAGRYIKIDIPGPGTKTGEGYDWVYVENIEMRRLSESSECLAITVQPAQNPTAGHSSVAHFFSSESSSTFLLCNNRNSVTMSVHGRNEVPNTHTSKPLDNIRNKLVAKSAIAFMSAVQWKRLVRGVIEGPTEEKKNSNS
ncbi:MAG: hypothetical protein H7Y31_08765 [Chitinophagaceae bacterium]|nr:hypothetical protein [Chitinophagaceae bacterium]